MPIDNAGLVILWATSLGFSFSARWEWMCLFPPLTTEIEVATSIGRQVLFGSAIVPNPSPLLVLTLIDLGRKKLEHHLHVSST